jgi:hypothetical protein
MFWATIGVGNKRQTFSVQLPPIRGRAELPPPVQDLAWVWLPVVFLRGWHNRCLTRCSRKHRRNRRHRNLQGDFPLRSADASPAPSNGTDDPVASLRRLKEMLDLGLIEQAEFDAKKAEIMSRM